LRKCNHTDQSGNSTVEEFLISVADNTPPLIQLTGPYTIVVQEAGQCGSDGIFDASDDPGFYASDDTDGDVTSMVEAVYNNGDVIDCNCDNSEDQFYTVTYTVADAAGNVATLDRQIRVDIQLNIETANLKVSEINVYNLIGKNIITLQEHEIKALTQLDLSNKTEGIYMVNVVTDKGTITRKVNVVRN